MFKQFKTTKNKYGLKTALYYHIPLFFTFKWKYWVDDYKGLCIAPIILNASNCKAKVLRHEIIHFWQQLVFTLPLFSVIYAIDYLIKFCMYRSVDKAYRNVIFEKYAYSNDDEHAVELAKIKDIAIRVGKDVNAS